LTEAAVEGASSDTETCATEAAREDDRDDVVVAVAVAVAVADGGGGGNSDAIF